MAESSETSRKRKRKKHTPVKMPWWVLYPLALGTVGGAVYFFRRDDPIAAGVFVSAVISALLGFRMGISTILVSILGLATAYWIAPPWGIALEPRFNGIFGTSGLTNRCLAIGTVALVVSLLITTVASMLIGGFLARRRKLDLLDRYLGLALGVGEGMFVVLLILAAFVRFNLGNRLGEPATKIAGVLNKSAVLPYVKRFDPFDRLPILDQANEWQQSVQYLREPQNVNALLRDPRVSELRQQPEYQAAIREFRNDPVVSELFDNGETIDREMLMRLMNSDAVLKLLDQKEFLDRMYDVLQDKISS